MTWLKLKLKPTLQVPKAVYQLLPYSPCLFSSTYVRKHPFGDSSARFLKGKINKKPIWNCWRVIRHCALLPSGDGKWTWCNENRSIWQREISKAKHPTPLPPCPRTTITVRGGGHCSGNQLSQLRRFPYICVVNYVGLQNCDCNCHPSAAGILWCSSRFFWDTIS